MWRLLAGVSLLLLVVLLIAPRNLFSPTLPTFEVQAAISQFQVPAVGATVPSVGQFPWQQHIQEVGSAIGDHPWVQQIQSVGQNSYMHPSVVDASNLSWEWAAVCAAGGAAFALGLLWPSWVLHWPSPSTRWAAEPTPEVQVPGVAVADVLSQVTLASAVAEAEGASALDKLSVNLSALDKVSVNLSALDNYAAVTELRVEHAYHPILQSFAHIQKRAPAPAKVESKAIELTQPEIRTAFTVPEFPSWQVEAPPSPRSVAMASVSGRSPPGTPRSVARAGALTMGPL